MNTFTFLKQLCLTAERQLIIIFLVILGMVAARTGRSSITKAILRITVWGTLAMGLSALVGNLFGVNL
ncbi:MAG: VIT1/CCC1 transporter family protein [Pelobium sp.]